MITRTELHNVTRITQKLQQFGTFSVLRISAYVDGHAIPATFDLFINNRDGLPIEVENTQIISD